jgi:hypothetical protein
MEAKKFSFAKMKRIIQNNHGNGSRSSYVDEKNYFLNRQDMAMRSIDMSVSPKLFHQVYEESQGSNTNELWTRLEVLFGNK